MHLGGEVDLSNVDVLEGALQQVRSCDALRQVIVDTTAITFLSVAGVEALVQAQAKGLDFALVAAQRAVLLPLQVTGMDQRIKLFHSLEAARRTD